MKACYEHRDMKIDGNIRSPDNGILLINNCLSL